MTFSLIFNDSSSMYISHTALPTCASTDLSPVSYTATGTSTVVWAHSSRMLCYTENRPHFKIISIYMVEKAKLNVKMKGKVNITR